MQKITIKNFGPIQDCEMEVNDFMVFIGPQASGKSTISKSIYFFKSLRDDLVKYIFEAMESEDFSKPVGAYSKFIKRKYLKFWGPTYHLNDIFLQYDYKEDIHIQITLEPTSKYIQLRYSPKFTEGFFNLINMAKDFVEFRKQNSHILLSSNESLALDLEARAFVRRITSLANQLFGENRELIFIPAGRNILATLSEQIQFTQIKTDYLMEVFIDLVNKLKPSLTKSLSELVTERKKLTSEVIDFAKIELAEKLIRQILRGSYRYDREGEKIYIDQERYVKINYSSSGQQESIWILHLIFSLILENREVFIVFEEPEAHLYPEAQKEIVDLIALLANTKDNQVIITTHSPYILTATNNLLYAYKVGQNKRTEVEQRIRKAFWIKPAKTSAFFIQNGHYDYILDPELDLIQAETIDSASDKINEDFDYLLNLEDI